MIHEELVLGLARKLPYGAASGSRCAGGSGGAEGAVKSMHFGADRIVLVQNLPVSSMLWPLHFRCDEVGVPTRQDMNIGSNAVVAVWLRAANHGLMSTGD